MSKHQTQVVRLGSNLSNKKAKIVYILVTSLHRPRLTANMRRKLAALLEDESGATAIEYGLIAADISVAIIAAVEGIGSNLKTKFGSVSSALK